MLCPQYSLLFWSLYNQLAKESCFLVLSNCVDWIIFIGARYDKHGSFHYPQAIRVNTMRQAVLPKDRDLCLHICSESSIDFVCFPGWVAGVGVVVRDSMQAFLKKSGKWWRTQLLNGIKLPVDLRLCSSLLTTSTKLACCPGIFYLWCRAFNENKNLHLLK